MTMWDLLLAMNLVMPITGAVARAHDLHAGWIGYYVAIVIGIVLGATSVWMLWAMGRLVVSSTPADDMRTTWQLRLLYWAAIVWPIAILFASGWLLSAALKMF
jgi:hypothetical protein